MFLRFNSIGLFALFTLVVACTTTSAPQGYKITEGSREGLVIMSFTQPYTRIRWYYHEILGNGEMGMKHDLLTGNEFTEDNDTLLNPVVLPAGEYEFYTWELGAPGGVAYRPRVEFSIRFKSVPGKAVYVGNINAPINIKTGQHKLELRDNRAKDIPLFLKYYPNIKQDQIEYQLMEFKGFDKRN